MCRWHSAWTDERVTTLRKLWLEGLSASQIAREMGGVSRNAVIGKVHRLGLKKRGAAQPDEMVARRINARRARAARQPTAPRIFAPIQEPDSPRRRALAALPPIDPRLTVNGLTPFTCRYPIGDPQEPDFAFCGRTCEAAEPYCCAHRKLVYTRATKHRPNTMERLTRWLDGQSKRTGMSV